MYQAVDKQIVQAYKKTKSGNRRNNTIEFRPDMILHIFAF